MARDHLHAHVREALEKDGWKITEDPYRLKAPGVEYEVDLAAEFFIAATKAGKKIAVEIKGFTSSSDTYEFHRVLGTFNSYFLALMKQEPERELFLAIPDQVYDDFFSKPFIQEVVAYFKMKIIVFNPDSKTVVLWIIH